MSDVERTAGEVQITVQRILRDRSVGSPALLQRDVVNRMRVRVGAQEAQAGRETLLGGHLQRMVCRKPIGGGITVTGHTRSDRIQKLTRSHSARSGDRLIDVVRNI